MMFHPENRRVTIPSNDVVTNVPLAGTENNAITKSKNDRYSAFSVVGSMILRISVTLVAGKPLRLACSWTTPSSWAM